MSIHSVLFAAGYDRFMAKTEKLLLADLRHKLLATATGDVLEIGGGTGANIAAYGPDVRSVTITEPDASMLRRLERHAKAAPRPVTVLQAPAEDLPFEDGTFDTVVSTLVLCGVSDQRRALNQIRRVLRRDGQLRFVEHVRSDEPKVARLQDRMNWLNRLMVCCECNRPTLTSIQKAGFTVDQLDHYTMPKAPPFVRPVIAGSATCRAAVPHQAA
ncbi:MAG TPA: class I SAM-dependent methyltransferase [Amycolatopsis sp.]|nr:class I SAM-dependent methyltransferase [Amycolatopsis sp.]